jgi:hypothetical protein
LDASSATALASEAVPVTVTVSARVNKPMAGEEMVAVGDVEDTHPRRVSFGITERVPGRHGDLVVAGEQGDARRSRGKTIVRLDTRAADLNRRDPTVVGRSAAHDGRRLIGAPAISGLCDRDHRRHSVRAALA